MTNFTVKLIIILIPGLISYLIYKRCTVRNTKRTDLMFITICILLGFLSYMLLQFLKICTCLIDVARGVKGIDVPLHLFSSLDQPEVPYIEVMFAIVLGIPLAYFLAFLDSKNWVNRLARHIGASTKINDENLYSVYLNDSETNWVYVRNFENNLTYLGQITLFSEKEDSGRELVLNDVTIYSYPDSVTLYSVSSVYLKFKSDANVVIEQAIVKQDNNQHL